MAKDSPHNAKRHCVGFIRNPMTQNQAVVCTVLDDYIFMFRVSFLIVFQLLFNALLVAGVGWSDKTAEVIMQDYVTDPTKVG